MKQPSHRMSRVVLGASLGATLLVSGCATGPNANPRDPLEPWNRGMYKFNDVLDKGLIKPVATVYDTVTPNPVQRGVRNVFNNLSDAWSAINSALQGKGQEAMNNFSRVMVNTLFGLGGMLDVATEAQIPRVKQDFGLTLGSWGVGTGPYVVWPVLGPSTVRDTVALPVDMYGDPIGAVNHTRTRNQVVGLNLVSRRAELLEAGDLLEQSALDPYTLMRDSYLKVRDSRGSAAAAGADSEGYEPPPEGMDGAAAAPQSAASGAATAPQEAASQAGSGSRNESSLHRGATPYTVPAVPTEIIQKIDSNMSPNLWRK